MPEVSEMIPVTRTKLSTDSILYMSIEEFETIRLLDYEGLTHEECARQMEVARTTVTGIYEEARKKIAQAFILGKRLIIEGGDYVLCENIRNCCGRCGQSVKACQKECRKKKEDFL